MCFNIAHKNIEFGSGHCPPESKLGLYRPFCRDRRPRRSVVLFFCKNKRGCGCVLLHILTPNLLVCLWFCGPSRTPVPTKRSVQLWNYVQTKLAFGRTVSAAKLDVFKCYIKAHTPMALICDKVFAFGEGCTGVSTCDSH